MVERQDRMVERQDRMENLMEQMVDSQSKTIGRLDRVEQAIISLANGINEFVEIHRQTTKTQNDRISNLERRMDRLEGNS